MSQGHKRTENLKISGPKNWQYWFHFFGMDFLKKKFWTTAQGEIVIFYTEILTGKVVLWCFFSSETSEKIHNSTFQVKISV